MTSSSAPPSGDGEPSRLRSDDGHPMSPDSMNTYVARHRDGDWCVCTASVTGERVVSRHATQEQAEEAATMIRGGDRG
jgi:hypothetical protein